MMPTKDLFHYISYLQYPIMIIGTYYALKPILFGFDTMLSDYNNLLIYLGLGISFSTLQDTQKTQNELSRKVWESPVAGKRFILFLSFFTLFTIVLGVFGMYAGPDNKIKELSFGLIVLGIGLMGMLKAAIEMFENHRKDKKIPTE